jgi:hypothetical protein
MSGIKITVLFLMTLLMVGAIRTQSDQNMEKIKGNLIKLIQQVKKYEGESSPKFTKMKAQLTELTLAYGKRVEEGNEMAAVTYYNIDGMSLLLEWMEHVLTLQGTPTLTE